MTNPMNSFKPKIPLRRKLLVFTVGLLAITFALASILVYQGMNKVSSRFIDLGKENSDYVQTELSEFSESLTGRIKKRYLDEFRAQAERLVKKDGYSMTPIFLDNSFSQGREFIQKVFSEDQNLLRAAFFEIEDNELKIWHYVDRNFPKGLDFGVTVNRPTKTLQGVYRGKKVSLVDSELEKIVAAEGPQFVESTFEVNGDKMDVLDAYIPVVQKVNDLGALKKSVQAAKSSHSKIGFLRYTISLQPMRQALDLEEKKFNEYLAKIEQQNMKTGSNTKQVGEKLLAESLHILGISILIVIGLSILVILYFARKLTDPVRSLIEVAREIASGKYQQKIQVTSSDEIGILAASFQSMADAIVRRDEELEELNRGLEKLVEKRTQELFEEMTKVKNLLDSMRQSVFSIDAEENIIAPISRFSKEIFKDSIQEKKIQNILYKDLDPNSEQSALVRTALSTIFGEDDIQWMLMEDNFPTEIDVTNSGTGRKSLKISYNPIYDQSGILKHLMLVVDDVTEARRLQSEVEKEKQKNSERMAILYELGKHSIADVRDFLQNCFLLMDACWEGMENPIALQRNRLEVLRNLHTIKGNSRVFGYTSLGNAVHLCEEQMTTLHDVAELSLEQTRIARNSLEPIEKILNKYAEFAESLFKIPNSRRKLLLVTAHQKLFQAKQATWESNLQEIHSSIRFIIPDEMAGDWVNWISQLVLNENLGTSNSEQILKIAQSLRILRALCQRDLQLADHGDDGPLIEKIAPLTMIFEDLSNLKKDLQGGLTDFVVQFEKNQWESPILKNLFMKMKSECATNYQFFSICAFLVNSYISKGAYASALKTVPVYDKNLQQLKSRLQTDSAFADHRQEMAELVERLYYVPLHESFERYYSMVDILAAQLGKKVRLDIVEKEVFVPSDWLQKINDALVHVLRNAIDHGIETPEERKSRGKPQMGLIQIKLAETSTEIRLEVADDGFGIDPQLIKKSAVAKNLRSTEEIDQLSEQQLKMLIFEPGFSTKSTVSDVSGRGVGMDAVRALISDEFHGQIELESQVNRGTKIVFIISKMIKTTSKSSMVA